MIRLVCTEQEARALAGLLHAGVQHLGLPAAKDAALWAEKLDAAVQAHESAPPRPDPE